MHAVPGRTWSRPRVLLVGGVAVAAIAGIGALAGAGGKGGEGSQITLPTTTDDFFQPGTRPDPSGLQTQWIVSATSCGFCHGDYDTPEMEDTPFNGWVGSLMAQSARDPVWHAALTIANQDADFAGEYCIRCHAPGAWLRGKSDTGTLVDFESDFQYDDFDGVNCHMCHRMVNPVLEDDSPLEDAAILADLSHPPGTGRGNARFVVDPDDVRRGPYEDIAMNPDMNMHGVPVIHSPWHRRSEMCATCHDVRNPVYSETPEGTYALNDPGAPHPTQDPHDMYPEQLTYSEWSASAFAEGGVAFPDGRYGGDNPEQLMAECQDCHMPDQVAGGCFAWTSPPWFERQDLGQHTFPGANTWVLKAIRAVYPDSDTRLSEDTVEASIARNEQFLSIASDTYVQQVGGQLQVRVVNQTGHKLPTGYPEGRRMWINVAFLDEGGAVVDERGAYDYDTATLEDDDTTVFEMKAGIDADVAAATGLPAGESFHLTLNNVVLKDNRIPPRGFTNAGYEAFDGAPVGETYADGQYWHDTFYELPKGAVSAVVNVYYQPMTRAYAEFLRDANVTDDKGLQIWDLYTDPDVGAWVPPTTMDSVTLSLGDVLPGDLDGDGFVDFTDLLALLAGWGPCPPPAFCPSDLDGDGDTDFQDLLVLLANWGG